MDDDEPSETVRDDLAATAAAWDRHEAGNRLVSMAGEVEEWLAAHHRPLARGEAAHVLYAAAQLGYVPELGHLAR